MRELGTPTPKRLKSPFRPAEMAANMPGKSGSVAKAPDMAVRTWRLTSGSSEAIKVLNAYVLDQYLIVRIGRKGRKQTLMTLPSP